MHLYFGLENAGQKSKVSASLEAQGLNFLRASPSQLPFRGLYTIYQPGYEEYTEHLPAFLEATLSGREQVIGKEGYPITTPATSVIQLPMPNVFIKPKKESDAKKIEEVEGGKRIKSRDVNGVIVQYQPGINKRLNSYEFDSKEFAPANTVNISDLPVLIVILRIFSAFLRTHSYPAFQEMGVEEKGDATLKRDSIPDNLPDTDESRKGKRVKIEKHGVVAYAEKSYADGKTLKVNLTRAKPNKSPLANPWGNVTNAPYTNGIAFPYLSDLCSWDKDTVPNIINRYFIRCLGSSTDQILSSFSHLCMCWKRSLYRTEMGNVLSHIAKCLEIGIPSQAHIYPVLEETYRGCIVSGYHFSVALRNGIYRPSLLETADYDTFGSNVGNIKKIMDVLNIKNDEREEFEEEAMRGMRYLDEALRSYTPDLDDVLKIRELGARLRYKQEYWKINMENLELAFMYVFDEGKDLDKVIPMHADGLYRSTRLESILAAFGPTVPSPQIPTGIILDISTGREPDNLVRPIVFRHASLDVAYTEWIEVGKTGKVRNAPANLSTKFQHIPIRGDNERKKFFGFMKLVFEDFKRKKAGGTDGKGLEFEGLLPSADSVQVGGVILDDTF